MQHPLADRAITQASMNRALEWWDANPTQIRRPEGSSLHKLVEDWNAGIVVIPEIAALGRRAIEEMILGQPQVFLVQHDWAGALGHAVDFETVEYRLPYDRCAFEFDISGHRVILIEHQSLGSLLAVHSVRHWCAFLLGSDYSPPQARETGLASIFQIAAENIRAMTIVLETGAARVQHVASAAALNRARVRSRKVPISAYNVVDPSRHRDPTNGEEGGAGGTGKRLHFRRGHKRRIVGGETWVKWTLAGNPSLGFIDKRYKL